MTRALKRRKMIETMKAKRGLHYTFGWLESAYAMPSSSEEIEDQLVANTMKELENLPDLVDSL